MNNFWDKIKNSNVVKVATAYGVVCWILLQVQDAVLPTIGAPIWVAQIILFIILIGFPIAVLIAWASEINSKSDVTQENNSLKPNSNTPKKNFLFIGILSFFIIALFAFYASPFIFDYEPKRSYSDNSPQNSSNVNIVSYNFDLNLKQSAPNEWGLLTEIAISNDGRYVAFTKNNDSSSDIFLRDLRSVDSLIHLVNYSWGTDVHGVLEFTEDDEWVSYFDSGVLKKVRITGGSPQTIIETNLGRTSGYDVKENKVLYTGPGDLLWVKDLKSGDESMVYNFDNLPGRVYRWPEYLPDNINIIVSSSSLVAANDDSDILIYNSKTGEYETLISNAYNARYISLIGKIVFVRDSSLWSIDFDENTLMTSGEEIQHIKNIQTNGILGSAAYSVSNNGRLIYLDGSDVAVASSNLTMKVISTEGKILETLPMEGRFGQVSFSPDGNYLSYTNYDGPNADLWVYDFNNNVSGRRTFNGKSNRSRWHPDGKNIIYANNFTIGNASVTAEQKSDGVVTSSIRMVSSDGAGINQEIFSNDSKFRNYLLQSISPNGDEIFFSTSSATGTGVNNEIYSLSFKDEIYSDPITKELILSPLANQTWWSKVSLSNDSQWLTYVSNESGVNQIYIRPYPNINDGKWQVSSAEGYSPIWDKDKNELYFHTGEKFYKVKYDIIQTPNGEFFNLNQPEYLFDQNIVFNHLTFPAWDYDQNNKRFVVISAPESELSDIYGNSIEIYNKEITLTIVENWFSSL